MMLMGKSQEVLLRYEHDFPSYLDTIGRNRKLCLRFHRFGIMVLASRASGCLFWTPKPLERTPQDTQIFWCGISKNLNLKLMIEFFHLLIIPMTLFNDIMPFFDDFIHVYGWNMSILWSPLKIWTPKYFTTANFRYPVSKSWLRHCLEYQELTLMLLVANFTSTIWCKKTGKITETLANGYSSESTQRELSNEYQHDRVKMVFKNLCILVLWTNVASAA